MYVKCSLCGKQVMKKDFIVWGNLKYAKCDSCGLIFQYPMFSKEELKKIYENYFNRTNAGKYGYKDYENSRSVYGFKEHYLSWLNNYITDKGPFCDFGCGTGNLIKLMIDEGHIAEGVEFSDEAISILKKKKITFFRYEDLNKIEGKKYKYISIIDVIEHLRTPLEDLKIINSLLDDGGILFIETINSDDFFAKYVYRDKWHGISPVHLYLWGRKTLVNALKECGFEVLSVKKYKMSGSFTHYPITKLEYIIAYVALLFGYNSNFLGYNRERLEKFVKSFKKSHFQFSFGDGIRLVAKKRRDLV